MIPGLGTSPGEGNGNPLQFSCLENPMDRRGWQAAVYGFTRIGHDWRLSTQYMSIESGMLSNRLILSHSLLFPSIFLSFRVFSNEWALRIRWPKYWSFSFSIHHISNEDSGLISFRIDWFDLFAVQGTVLLRQAEGIN